MNTIKTIPLEQIAPNPFQPRMAEDLAHVQEIALSIAVDDMLQIPSGREVGEGVQLAFGMTRLASFRLLNSIAAGQVDGNAPELIEAVQAAVDAGRSFDAMPVHLVAMEDEQMFRHAISENLKRKDLNHIEIAQAMHMHMEHFGRTSKETGLLFGMNESTVRGMVRLLELPDVAQAKIATGEISLNAARRLLTLQRAKPDLVEKVAREMDSDNPEELISRTLVHAENTVVMWESWRSQDEEALAGSDLWPLAMPADQFPKEHLPVLEGKTAAKALGISANAQKREWLNDILVKLEYDPASKEQLIDEETPISKKTPEEEDEIERLALLVNPPACTACPLHVRIERTHYCAFRACYNRKKEAWAGKAAAEASAALEIPVYDKEADGRVMQSVSTGYYSSDLEDKLKEKYGDDLRLMPKPGLSHWSSGVKVEHVQAVVVGESAKKLKAKAKKEREQSSDDEWKERQRRYELQHARYQAILQYLYRVASPVFMQVLEGITVLPVLEALGEEIHCRVEEDEEPAENTPKKTRLAYYRQLITQALLENEIPDEANKQEAPVQYMAKHLQGVAKTWGVQLPAGWIEQARAAEFEPAAEEPE